MNCRYCGQPMPDGAERCPACGALDPYFTVGTPAQQPGDAPVQNQAAAPNTDAPAQGQYTAPTQGQYTPPTQGQYTPPTQGQYTPPAQGQYAAPAAPQNTEFAAQVQKAQRKNKGSAIGFTIGRIVVGLIVIALVAGGFNLFHKHASFLSQGETVNLDELLAKGEDYPVGEFVHVDAPFVLDVFAKEENTMNGVTSSEDYYYLIMLQNNAAIAVKAGSVDDIAVLDKGTDDSIAYLNKEIEMFDDIPLDGKLTKLTDSKITQYFDEAVQEYGFKDADSKIKPEYYVIDMTAARAGNVLLFIVLPVAVIIAVIVVISIVRKKKKKAAAQPQPMNQFPEM